MREKVLEMLNNNRFYNERALEIANAKDKVYVVFDTHHNKLANIGTTNKFAEYFIERETKEYTHWIDYNVY